MAEVSDEASYVPHHPKKIAFLFSAMRHFAQKLQQDGPPRFEPDAITSDVLDLVETRFGDNFGTLRPF
jgi:deoxyribodipyrimidine photolyase-like uncharacterized protein